MRAKRSIREWFTAELRGNTLVPRRGCTRVVVTLAEEIEESSTRESHRSLMANIGDRLILCGPSINQIALAEVTSVVVDGWRASLIVSLGAGGVNDGTVHVLKELTVKQQAEVRARRLFITLAFALAAIEDEDLRLAAGVLLP